MYCQNQLLRPKVSKIFVANLFFSLCLLLSATLFTACKDSRGKMADFVEDYNQQARFMRSPAISGTIAEALYNEKIIRIKVRTVYSLSDSETSFVGSLMPNVMMEALRRQPSTNDLINNNVKFEIIFYTQKMSEIASVIFDKKKMDEMNNSSTETKPSFFNPKPASSRDDKKFDEILGILNKNLPYTDKSTGLIIFKISHSRTNELVYHVTVPKNLAQIVKTKAGVKLMKSEIVRSGKIKELLTAYRNFSIHSVKYQYYDEKSNPINEISISSSDFN